MRRRKSRKSRRRSGGFSRGARGFVYMPKGIIKDGLIAAGAFVGVDIVGDKFINKYLPASAQSGWGRVLATAGVGAVLAGLASRFAGAKVATAIATGSIVKAGVDAWLQYKGQPQTNFSGYADSYPGVNGFVDQDLNGFVDQPIGALN